LDPDQEPHARRDVPERPSEHQDSIEATPQRPTGAWLRSFCRDHDITLQQIGECLDVPAETVRYYEQRDRPLPSWWLEKLQPLAAHRPEQEDLVALIVRYRMQFGRVAGQSAVEVLAWIAHDLRVSGAEESVSYEEIGAAVECLLTARRARSK
jgi:hypothetical protein